MSSKSHFQFCMSIDLLGHQLWIMMCHFRLLGGPNHSGENFGPVLIILYDHPVSKCYLLQLCGVQQCQKNQLGAAGHAISGAVSP